MIASRLVNFGGELPGQEARTIPENCSTQAANVRLTSARLDPIYADVAVTTCKAASTTIYRLLDGTWLSWTEDVNIALSPIAGDTSHKFCFTSDSFEPRQSNSAMAQGASPPNSWYVLGVTPPVTAPTVAPSGGSATNETRTYCYTFVTQWGEESAPSPACALVTGHPDGTWAVSAMDVAPSNTYAISAAAWAAGTLTLTVGSTFGLRAGEYVTLSLLAPAVLNASYKVASVPNTTHFTITMADPGTITDGVGTATRNAPHNTTSMTKRLYRSVTTATDTQFYFTKEIAVATTSTNDDVGSAIGEPLPTLGWVMPPVNLQGIMNLPSGALVGFYDNVVCFSEPDIPYAWPIAYRNTSDYTVVGLDAIGTAVVVGTKGTPYVVDGVEPATASMSRINQLWPCAAKNGMVAFNNGVYYPTTVGLAFCSLQGSKIVSDGMYTQYEWSALNPASFVGATFANLYYTIQKAGTTTQILVIAPDKWITRYNITADVVYTDGQLGRIYYAYGSHIYEVEPVSGVAQQYTYRTKTIVVPQPINLGAVKLDTDTSLTAQQISDLQAASVAAAAANAALAPTIRNDRTGMYSAATFNTYGWNDQAVDTTPIPTGAPVVQFTLFTDDGDVPYFTKSVLDNTVFRLPAGRKYDNFQLQVASNVSIRAILFGETADDLRKV